MLHHEYDDDDSGLRFFQGLINAVIIMTTFIVLLVIGLAVGWMLLGAL